MMELAVVVEKHACLMCNVCIKPITSSPFYKYLQLNCHFLIHNTCANLSSTVYFPIAQEFDTKASLCRDPSECLFNLAFSCIFYHRPCNGFCYYIDNTHKYLFVDLESMVTPNTIKHMLHRQYVLFRIT